MRFLYQKFDWPEFHSIQQKLVPVILDIVDNMRERYLFNKFTAEQIETIYHAVPEFRSTIDQRIGDRILDIKAIYIDENFRTKNVAHIDDEEKTAETYFRLNWPILNSDNHETVYFLNDQEPTWEEIPGGTSAFTFDEDQLQRIDSFILDRPTLMNVLEIHGMYPIDTRFPRIILTVDFENSGHPAYKQLLETGQPLSF